MDLNDKKLFSREFEQRLQILKDLSPKDMQALHEISEGLPLTVHPSARNSLKHDNLIVTGGKGFKLTLLGQTVYKRALDMLHHDWDPGRYLDANQMNLLKGEAPVSVASRIRKYLGVQVENGAVKLAIFLGSGPQAYRQLSRCWGVELASNDLVGIVGEPMHPDRAVRGELIGLGNFFHLSTFGGRSVLQESHFHVSCNNQNASVEDPLPRWGLCDVEQRFFSS